MGLLEGKQLKYEAVARETTRCQTKINDNSARLVSSYSNRITNEAALRYVLGDEAMQEMICNTGNLKGTHCAIASSVRFHCGHYSGCNVFAERNVFIARISI